jgi:hypothetical protein
MQTLACSAVGAFSYGPLEQIPPECDQMCLDGSSRTRDIAGLIRNQCLMSVVRPIHDNPQPTGRESIGMCDGISLLIMNSSLPDHRNAFQIWRIWR